MIRERALKIVMGLVGVFFVLAVYPIMINLWPRWQPNHEVEQMMLSVYATLGVFLLLALRSPSANRSLIAFTAWSSFAHAAVMTVQAAHLVSDRPHLLGASTMLVLIGIALIALAPRKQPTDRASAAGT